MLMNNLSATSCMLPATAAPTFAATIRYQEDFANFPNPKRGYYITSVSANAMQAARKEGMTLVRKYYILEAYCDTDVLPQSILDGFNIRGVGP
jgi:hypothetical protein